MEKLTAVAAAAASAAAAKALQSSAQGQWGMRQNPWLGAPMTLAQLRQQVCLSERLSFFPLQHEPPSE